MSAKDAFAIRSVHEGVVSVVIDAAGDPDAALACVDRVASIDWPADLLEPILVVDIGEADRLRPVAAEHHTKAIVVGCSASAVGERRNAGADAARGEHLAFLDRDAVPEDQWLRAGVGALHVDAHAGAAASKVLDADGSIAFVDAGMTFAGEPLLLHAGEPDTGTYDRSADLLFPSTWAFVVEARAFRYLKGFDSALCPGIEHVDLGWRLNLAGLTIRGTPASTVRLGPDSTRAESGTAEARIAMVAKNLDDANLSAAVAAALLLEGRGTDRVDGADAVRQMPDVLAARAEVQALRRVADAELLALFRQPFSSGSKDEHDAALVRALTGIEAIFATRRKVLVITPDVLQPKMAGPGIRAYEMARALAREHDVRLVSTMRCDLDDPEVNPHRVNDATLRNEVAWADVVIFQGHVIEQHPWLRHSDKILVVDIYDPFHLEVLEQSRDLPPFARRHSVRVTVETLNEQLIRGDFFLCASEKQRDFWLGQLTGVGRLNPATYDHHENLASLIAVVPFGVNDDPPKKTRPVLKGVVPGIGEDDKVVLWGGGVYNWFDPITLLHAFDKLRVRLPEVRLYFMGMRHPNPNVPAMQMAYRAQQLAQDLGLVGTHVFFNEGWVDYDERQNYLLEADVGVSTHLDHVETAFSFRTRILDYLWASLPVVATGGDAFEVVIEQHGLGITVPPDDVDALEEALFTMLSDEERRDACRRGIEALVPELRWSRAVAPLLDFCRTPHRARDLVDPRQRVMLGDPLAQAMWGHTGWKHMARVAIGHVKNREWEDLSRKVRMRLRLYFDPTSAGPGARER